MPNFEEDSIAHYGTKRHSGRYPYGSGDDPNQHSDDFLSRINELKKSGYSEVEIASAMGLSTTELRAQKAIEKTKKKNRDADTAQSMRDKGYSYQEIADKLGYSGESSIRSLLNEKAAARRKSAQNTADFLKKRIEESDTFVDVGKGVEAELNVSSTKLNEAVNILINEGYTVAGVGVPQATNPGKQTNLKLVGKPGTTQQQMYEAINNGNIATVTDYISRDDGETFQPAFRYPESLSSKRLMIRYADDKDSQGVKGIEKDGVIELRRGVDDISLGNSVYSQVRIMVDGTHYLKGMAVYSDDMPAGIDVVFNTNKSKDVPALGEKDHTVLKPIKKDPENPFGSAIKEHGGQSEWIDENGKSHLRVINKRADEGDWSEWKDKVPSQFLAKQNIGLAKRQINLELEEKKAELAEIEELTNPTVKKKLLEGYASDCDSLSVHLSAAALPRQKYHVILPVNSLSDKEIYAPNYEDGEKVALVRYPHAGTFEIPILTVNNKNPDGQKMIGKNSSDAVGITAKVAERLSGADFDGDTVMVIPTNDKIRITSTPPLQGLIGFDPKVEYPYREGMHVMTKREKQLEMGKASNLIADMTIAGATSDELARAVRHSMVVIDAEKHRLDYKRSEEENGILALKEKYQGEYNETTGRLNTPAATIITRAKSEVQVPKRQGSGRIDPETGKMIYKEADDLYYYDKYKADDDKGHKKGEVKFNKDGTPKLIMRKQKSSKMAETDDPYSLVSKYHTDMELLYADYASQLKGLANQARLDILSAGNLKYSPSAKKTYATEVETLDAKLALSISNAPKERLAQIMAKSDLAALQKSNPDMTTEEKKKAGSKALLKYRAQIGSKRNPIVISDREWEAIQAGAISENKLMQILNNSDLDYVKQKSTPRSSKGLTTAQINRVKALANSGHTNSQIAKAMGISASAVSNYLKGE